MPGRRRRNRGLDLLERKGELVGVKLLRTRPEARAAQLPQQRLEPCRMRLLVRDLRLEMQRKRRARPI
jgi:hypothetical protein